MQTFIANLKHAVRNRETVSIAGGTFNAAELAAVLAHLESTQPASEAAKGKKTVFTMGGQNPFNGRAGALIEVTQDQNRAALFTVAYGLQVHSGLTYARAAKELGENIFHHLACESILNNEGR